MLTADYLLETYDLAANAANPYDLKAKVKYHLDHSQMDNDIRKLVDSIFATTNWQALFIKIQDQKNQYSYDIGVNYGKKEESALRINRSLNRENLY